MSNVSRWAVAFAVLLTGCRACTTKMFGPKVSSTTLAGHDSWEARMDSSGGIVPTATVVDGVAIVGDGYSSTSLVGLDAKTGSTRWRTALGDNGAGPAVAEGDAVAFTTESCTLYVADAKNGAIRWSKWLGDPLVSHPAIASQVVYVVAPREPTATTGHALFAFDAKDGHERWKTLVGADAIGAPIVLGDRVYVSTQDGTLTRFDAKGTVVWSVAAGATSSPVPDGAGSFFVVAREHGVESVRRVIDGENPTLSAPWHPHPYGDAENTNAEDQQLESVARFDRAQHHLGTSDSATLWSWQGGRPSVSGGRVFALVANELVAFDVNSGAVLWTAPFDTTDRDRAAPPVAHGTKVYLATARGFLEVRDGASGALQESIPLGAGAAFPPVVDANRILVSTTDGRVVSIKL